MDNNGNRKKRQQRVKIAEGLIDQNDSGKGDSLAAACAIMTPVDEMTSRDFHLDYNAHIEMMGQVLKDTVRIETFRSAILHNKHLFQGKTVLNIGCGTGIYALFAAKAGAAKVYAVDSSNVVYYTRKIVEANGYSEIIKVIKGEIEEIDLPVMEVDIIVCDWVGYALLYQSICDSVIFARDKWLKNPGGLIFPDQGKLYMVALEDTKHKNANIDWWSDVYGFNMRCLREMALIEPRCQSIRPEQVISKQFPIKSINLNTATVDDLKFRSKFMLLIHKTGLMDGLALYFHVYFTKSHTPLGFSTDPWSPRTNWLQTILFFDQTISVNSGSLYYGGIEFTSNEKTINLNDIHVNLELLKGDPKQADIEIEMFWHFKLTTAISECKKKNCGENNSDLNFKINEKSAEHKIKKNIDSKIYQENIEGIKNSMTYKNALTCGKAIRCPGSVITRDNLNNTITISKYTYSSRKNKRNQCKYTKKD